LTFTVFNNLSNVLSTVFDHNCCIYDWINKIFDLI
jgi:hypothetical protein